jgi:hypothetical protein
MLVSKLESGQNRRLSEYQTMVGVFRPQISTYGNPNWHGPRPPHSGDKLRGTIIGRLVGSR